MMNKRYAQQALSLFGLGLLLLPGYHTAGAHAFGWGGRDTRGRQVSAGTHFGRLKEGAGSGAEVQVRKMVVLH